MDWMRRLSEALWSEQFWLPANVTWEHLKSTSTKAYPDFYALMYPIPLAVVIFLVRQLVEKFIYEPLGKSLNIPNRRPEPPKSNAQLETAFQASKHPSDAQILALAKRCDMSERQVLRWFRHRNGIRKGQLTQLDKFKETGWRFTFYLTIFLYGLWALWDKPWLTDGNAYWKGYPFQTVSSDVWWYYMLELGFYWSLLISQFTDVKRKDFWEMFLHHIVTISLMVFSWTDNTIRIGSMVLIIHDSVDFWLEGAKLARYAKKTRLSAVVFAIFATVWIFTRLGLYPYRILSYSFPCPLGDLCFPAFHLYNALLGSLQILHVFWTFTIIRVIYRALTTGETEDVRSDTEESDNGYSDTEVTPEHGDGITSPPEKKITSNGNGVVSTGRGSGDVATELNHS
ncbi:hypothetical protein RvY_07206 [Ramazzottius varieornatus]|uniref:Homeobox domain-containing protein n=1 Tax=Ramazzottius varieornatus TaxID=947166 RepID=A0A1D1V1A0_RAMVA|nr:hypothetical protein RvY_07206 [Ramazzottius varieornatus]